MGGKGSKLAPKDLSDLKGKTNFSDDDIRKFHQDFIKLHPNGKMTKKEMIE